MFNAKSTKSNAVEITGAFVFDEIDSCPPDDADILNTGYSIVIGSCRGSCITTEEVWFFLRCSGHAGRINFDSSSRKSWKTNIGKIR